MPGGGLMLDNDDVATPPTMSDIQMIPVTARLASIDKESWWNTATGGGGGGADASSNMDVGAGPLVYRCMREYYWSKDYALRVLKGYRQFLELKTILEDWEAKILAPSTAVHQMWHQHILDITNYCHDCALLCGRVLGNDPDGALDEWTQEKRRAATKQLLRARFVREIDGDVWRFDEGTTTVARMPPGGGSHHHHSAGGEGLPRNAPSFVSGLTAEEKKYETAALAAEEKQRRYIPANPFSYQAQVADYESSHLSKYQQHPPHHSAMYDEKKDDDGATYSSKSRSSKVHQKDSVVIHDVQEKEIEVEEQTVYPIRIRTLKGSIYTLTVNKHMTVYEVKGIVQREYGVPQDKQHLLFYGKVLDDRKTLEECAIPPESGLQLLVRSRKPMDMSSF